MQPSVLLFNPAPRRGVQAHRRVELPLSLLCPATTLDRLGYRVRIVDQFADPDWEQALEAGLAERPICFGISCMTGPQILRAIEVAQRAKTVHPDLPVVWGGIHGSLLPDQTVRHPAVDVVVVGEGEDTLADLVRAFETGAPLSGVNGIFYKEDGKVKATPSRAFVDLDKQPFLSYDLLNLDLYRRTLFGVDHLTLNSSRGCTFRCAFCWDPVMHQRRWRAMQPDTVLEHMRRLAVDYGVRGFLFSDDHFFIDLDRARGILEGVVRGNMGFTISKLQIRADTICRMDDEFFELMVRAGVKRFTVGIESGSQRMLDLIKKDITVDEALEANRKLARYPFVPLYLFMMGMPTETPEDFGMSIRLADQMLADNPRAVKTFNIYTPYPGTELFGVALNKGLTMPERLEDWAGFNFRNVQKDSPWMEADTRRLVRDLDFPLMFLGDQFTAPYRATNKVVVSLSRLYAPVARYRVRHLDVRLPIESRLARTLGVFGRQG